MRKRRNPELLFEMSQPRIVPTVTKQPECILEAMELISESANNSHLTEDFFKAVYIPATYLSDRLQITPLQAVLFSLLMDQSEDTSIRLSDVAEITGCSTTRMLRLSKSLEGLAEKFYIRIKRGRSCDTYRIPREVIMSLREDKPYEYKNKVITNVGEFFSQYGDLFDERRSEELSYEMFRKMTEECLDQIRDSKFVRTLNRNLSDGEDRLLFIHLAYIYVSCMDDYINLSQITEIYDDECVADCIRREFKSKSSSLLDKLIENSNIDGLAQPDTFRLTKYAKNEVLSEVILEESRHSKNQLTKWDSLKEKTLIYNEAEREQISELTGILMADKFKDIQENLEEAGLRRGFCCLFYGAPGTGKTETVYQIARQTKRDILQVNVDEIKSCWVGESEKNIKELFDRYRSHCQDSKVAPILLFNEADAVLGRRMERAVRGVDKMENSIQNIILQEMEKLDGIMIATTNLTCNLDDAFERRFLYKIKYERPSEEARSKIWMQMLKGLDAQTARILASRFNFSGGEIENIVRKHSVSAILKGRSILDISTLSKICEQERIQTESHRRVGF